MNRRMCCLYALAFLAFPRFTYADQDTVIPTNIEAQLKENARALSPITVRWTVKRTSRMPLRELFTLMNYSWDLAGEAFIAERIGLIRLDANKLYRRFEYPVPIAKGPLTGSLVDPAAPATKNLSVKVSESRNVTGYEMQISEVSCDANNLYTGLFRGDQESGLIIRPIQEAAARYPLTAQDDTWNSDYFRQAGYRLPRMPSDFLLDSPVRHEVLYWASQPDARVSVSSESLDGQSCLVIEIHQSTGHYRYHLDESIGFAVKRRQQSDPQGHVLTTANMRNFRKLDSSPPIWLPIECEVDHHVWTITGAPVPPADEPIFSESYNLVEVTQDAIPLEAFVLNYTASGVNIRDYRLDPKKGVSYVVPADPRDLDAVIENAKSGKTFTPSELSKSNPSWKWIIINLSVVAGLVIAILVRWYRSRAKRIT